MFQLFKQRYVYRGLRKRYLTDKQAYRDKTYLFKLRDLLFTLSEETLLIRYQPRKHIDVQYSNIVVYLEECHRRQRDVYYNQLRLQNSLPTTSLTMSSFLTTDEGYDVEIYSAVKAVVNSLVSLTEVITDASRSDNSGYYYNQLKELYTSGFAFLYQVLESYLYPE